MPSKEHRREDVMMNGREVCKIASLTKRYITFCKVHAEKTTIGCQTMEGIFIIHVEVMEEMSDKRIGTHVLIGRKGTVDCAVIFVKADKNDHGGWLVYSE
jgi:hypothetical protein